MPKGKTKTPKAHQKVMNLYEKLVLIGRLHALIHNKSSATAKLEVVVYDDSHQFRLEVWIPDSGGPASTSGYSICSGTFDPIVLENDLDKAIANLRKEAKAVTLVAEERLNQLREQLF